MAKTLVANTQSKYQVDMDHSIESAVKRLIENGATRGDALRRIEKALSESIYALDSVGLGGVSRLRRLMLTCGVKIVQTSESMAHKGVMRDGV
jgi:hypothetical protein